MIFTKTKKFPMDYRGNGHDHSGGRLYQVVYNAMLRYENCIYWMLLCRLLGALACIIIILVALSTVLLGRPRLSAHFNAQCPGKSQ